VVERQKRKEQSDDKMGVSNVDVVGVNLVEVVEVNSFGVKEANSVGALVDYVNRSILEPANEIVNLHIQGAAVVHLPGYINLNVQVESAVASTRAYVVPTATSYTLLLGRRWLK